MDDLVYLCSDCAITENLGEPDGPLLLSTKPCSRCGEPTARLPFAAPRLRDGLPTPSLFKDVAFRSNIKDFMASEIAQHPPVVPRDGIASSIARLRRLEYFAVLVVVLLLAILALLMNAQWNSKS